MSSTTQQQPPAEEIQRAWDGWVVFTKFTAIAVISVIVVVGGLAIAFL